MPELTYAGLVDLGFPPGTFSWALQSVDELKSLAETIPEANAILKDGLQQEDVDQACDLLINQINIVRPVLRTCPFLPVNAGAMSGDHEQAYGKLLDIFKDPAKFINTINTVLMILRLFNVPVPPIVLPLPAPAPATTA